MRRRMTGGSQPGSKRVFRRSAPTSTRLKWCSLPGFGKSPCSRALSSDLSGAEPRLAPIGRTCAHGPFPCWQYVCQLRKGGRQPFFRSLGRTPPRDEWEPEQFTRIDRLGLGMQSSRGLRAAERRARQQSGWVDQATRGAGDESADAQGHTAAEQQGFVHRRASSLRTENQCLAAVSGS